MRLIKNMAYSTIYQVLILIIPLITAPYVSRVLGASGVGISNYTGSFVSYFSLIAGLGVQLYGNREIAYYQNNKKEQSRIFFEVVGLRLLAVAVSLLLYFVFVYFQPRWQVFFLIQTGMILAVCFDLSWFFMGKENFKIIVVRNSIIRIAVTISIFLFIHSFKDLWLYLLLNMLAGLLGNLSVWPFVKRELVKIKFSELHFFKHLKPILLLFFPQVSITIYTSLNKNLLGIFSGVESVAYFSQAYLLINMVATLVSSFNTAFLPHLSGLFADNDTKRVKELVLKSVDLGNFFSILCVAGLIGVSATLPSFFFGKEFQPVGLLLAVGALTVFFLALTNALSTQYLLASKKMKEYLHSTIVGLVINVAFNFLLIPFLGPLGAILATLLTEMGVACYVVIVLRDVFKVTEIFEGIWKYIVAGAITALIIYFCNVVVSPSLLNYLWQAVLGIIVYMGLLSLFKAPIIGLIIPQIKSIVNSKRKSV